MNKAEFIEELDGRIAVLTEDERRDILDEYEQHIDIKVMRGMSEEDAIADFGRMEELVADILEAYHVRADYAGPSPDTGRHGMREKMRSVGFWEKKAPGGMEGQANDRGGRRLWQTFCRSGKTLWQKAEQICGRIIDWGKRTGHSCLCGIRWLGRKLKKGSCSVIAFFRKPFPKRGGEGTAKILPEEENGNIRRKGKRKMKREAGVSITGAIEALFEACASAAIWCLKWFWNLFWLGTGILFGFGSCLVIFFMGMLAVLLLLGYPLAGVTVGWLGLTMCMTSATVWCFSLIIGKKKRKQRKGGHGAPAANMEEEAWRAAETAEE